MLEFDISYSSRSAKVTGPDRVAFRTNKEILDFTQQLLVSTARDFLKEQQNKNDFPKEYLTLVDGKLGAGELTVKPLGEIVYTTKLEDIATVIIDIFGMILDKTPLKTGYYSSMHVLLYNGNVVARGYSSAKNWLKQDRKYKDTDKFRIINLSPYARKLERLGIRRGKSGGLGIDRKYRKGKNKKTGNAVRLPNGVYWLAARTAKKTFLQLKGRIRFSFIPVSPTIASGQNTKTFSPNSFKFETGAEGKKGRPYLYPSITITINPGSFTSNAGFTESGGNL